MLAISIARVNLYIEVTVAPPRIFGIYTHERQVRAFSTWT